VIKNFFSRRAWLALGALVAAALLLRLHHLGAQSLWMDEYLDWFNARMDFLSMLAGVRVHRGGLPLHYVVQHLILKLGNSETWLRLSAAGFSTAAVAAAFAWARTVYPRHREIAWFTALGMAVSVFQLRYAQEARFYGLFVLMTVSLWWRFVCALKTQKQSAWLIYLGVAVLAAYTHYYTFLILVCHWVLIAWQRRHESAEENSAALRWMSWVFGITLLAFIPAALIYLTKEARYASFHWQWPLLGTALRTLAGGLSAWLLVLVLGTGLFKSGPERAGSAGIAVSALFLLGCVIGLDLWKGYFFHVRQLIFIQPPVILLMAAGMSAGLRALLEKMNADPVKRERWVLFSGVISMLLIFGPMAWAYKTETKFDQQRFGFENVKPQWREGVAALNENASPNSLVLCLNHVVKKGVDYHAQQQGVLSLPVAQVAENAALLKTILAAGYFDEYWLADGDVFDGYFSRLPAGDQAWLPQQVEKKYDFYQVHIWKLKNPAAQADPKAVTVKFGISETRMFLGEGWWEDDDQGEQHDAIWSRGDFSTLMIPVRTQAPSAMLARMQPVAAQAMEILVNGISAGKLDVHAGWGDYRLALPAQGWRRGTNLVEFRYTRAQRYHKWARTRAVLWDYARFE
jgi:uncharacterized membrane protein